VIQNQVASLEEFRAAHPPNAEVPPKPEYPVDYNFVVALNVVHQQVDEETTAQFVDCQEELHTVSTSMPTLRKKRECWLIS
jgi:hypothetical protein